MSDGPRVIHVKATPKARAGRSPRPPVWYRDTTGRIVWVRPPVWSADSDLTVTVGTIDHDGAPSR